MTDYFYNEIKSLKDVKIFKNINIKNETTLKMNSIFLYKIEILSFKIIKRVFSVIKKYNIQYYILGNGSNVLFAKKFFQGVLIKLKLPSSKYLNVLSAGESLNTVNNKFIKQGISSLDFLAGVPCSIGGAIYMNASAFNESMANIIEHVYVYDIDEDKYQTLNKNECEFGYRTSYFHYHNLVILGAKIKLIYGNLQTIKQTHVKRLMTRREKLPLEYPNIGSIFKNPIPFYAGKLIEELGLKGTIIGGAKISEKHANVIINYNDANYEDIIKLIDIIKKEVYIKYKILLEEEIITFK